MALQHLNRHLFRCPCKHAWRIDSDQRVISSKAWYELNNTRLPCPACGRFLVKGALVRGTYNADKVCNGKCMGATGPACDCSCSGANHGANH